MAAVSAIGSPMNRLRVSSSPLNGSLNSPKNKVVLLSSATTSLRQVDYDSDVTPLYEAIGNAQWDTASTLCNPKDASTWVVRYERDTQTGNKLNPHRIQWRFLPIHSACALNPPATFLRKLLNAYPDGPRTLDDQGLLPLHYACGARCCREAIYSLLMNFPQAALREDPNGMLPLHYLAQWGPGGQQGTLNMGVLDMVLVSTGDKAANCDSDGNTAERLARNAEYDGHMDVAKHIASFLHKKGLGSGADPASSGSSSVVEVIRSPNYKNKRPVLNINVASPSNQFTPYIEDNIDEETVIEHAPEGNVEISITPLSLRENSHHNLIPRSYSGQVHKIASPSPHSTPKSARQHRAFSWDHVGHNNENNVAKDTLSISGSTWTTHLSSPPPMSSPLGRARLPPMSPQTPRGSSTPRARGRGVSQSETRQDSESGRGTGQSFQSGSTSSTNSSTYSAQLTQQLVEIAEMERREGFESPRGKRNTPTNAEQKLLLEEISRLKLEKERAVAELAQAKGTRLVGSIMGLSELSPIGEDEMSRLTEDHEGEQGNEARDNEMASDPPDQEEPIHEDVKEDYKGLLEKEQKEHIETKKRLEEERKNHGEAIHSHLQEVKSLRESLEMATEEIAKHQSVQSEVKELQKKELEWNATREKLEAEIKHLKESTEQNGGSDNSIMSTLTNNSGFDSSVLRIQLESSVKEASDLRKFSATLRKEHNETISELEEELEKERAEKSESISKVVTLEYRVSELEEELEGKGGNGSSRRIAELEAKLSREQSSKAELKQLVSILEKDMEEIKSLRQGSADIDRMAFELHQTKKKLKEAEKTKELFDAAKKEFEGKERSLRKQLDSAQAQLELTNIHSPLSPDSHHQKIRALKMRIQALEEAEDNNLEQLRNAEKLKERAIREKEDECDQKVRQLRKEYEDKLQHKEDSYLQDIREKKRQENEFREKEESYLRDLQALQSKEDMSIKQMIEEKENAFHDEVAKLTEEIEILRHESKSASEDMANINELEAKLSECKSELKSQSRKYKAEINKLKNTLEMQKSKEARLEGHIKTMEKQIMDMTADYEDRIQEYLYGNLDKDSSMSS